MEILAVYNFKGGVGKTATAVNLSYLSAREGARTLVWDLDPQGAATYTFRIRPKLVGGVHGMLGGGAGLAASLRATDFEGLDLLPADFSCRDLDAVLQGATDPGQALRDLIGPLEGEYDRVILDCAPSISNLSEGIFRVADTLLAPTLPTPLSLRTLARLMKHLRASGLERSRVLAFLGMVDRRKALHRNIEAFVAREGLGFLTTRIPYSSSVEQMATQRLPVCVIAPADRASRAYEALWAEVQSSPRRPSGVGPSSKALKGLVRDVAGRV